MGLFGKKKKKNLKTQVLSPQHDQIMDQFNGIGIGRQHESVTKSTMMIPVEHESDLSDGFYSLHGKYIEEFYVINPRKIQPVPVIQYNGNGNGNGNNVLMNNSAYIMDGRDMGETIEKREEFEPGIYVPLWRHEKVPSICAVTNWDPMRTPVENYTWKKKSESQGPGDKLLYIVDTRRRHVKTLTTIPYWILDQNFDAVNDDASVQLGDMHKPAEGERIKEDTAVLFLQLNGTWFGLSWKEIQDRMTSNNSFKTGSRHPVWKAMDIVMIKHPEIQTKLYTMDTDS